MKSNRQTRSIQIRAAPQNGGEETWIVEGYAAIFDSPYVLYSIGGTDYSEIIARSALEGADMSDVRMLYNHDGHVLARTSNGTLRIECDAVGLHVWADLSTSAAAREMYEEIKSGLITQMSWAFDIQEECYDREKHTDTITRIGTVYDVSAVSYPANDQTSITARKRADELNQRGLDKMTMRRRAALAMIQTMRGDE